MEQLESVLDILDRSEKRYGGRPAAVARKAYALVCCFGFSVIVIAYITGFFTKTVAPLLSTSCFMRSSDLPAKYASPAPRISSTIRISGFKTVAVANVNRACMPAEYVLNG